jgi:hypothetical protein
MRADVRAIDVEHVPIDSTVLIQLQVQTLEDSIEQPFSRPTPVTTVDRLPLAIAFRHVTPLRAAVQNPEHPVQNSAMIGPATSRVLLWQQWFDPLVGLVSQLITTTRASLHSATTASRLGTLLLGHAWPPCRRPASLYFVKGATVQAPNNRSVKQNLVPNRTGKLALAHGTQSGRWLFFWVAWASESLPVSSIGDLLRHGIMHS